jgi:dienelactone hydrolase
MSLYRPGQVEDVFPYHRPRARWMALRAVRLPIAAILGGRDEFLDRPAREVIEAFRENATRAAVFTGTVIPGANHGFQRRERVLADTVVRWIRDL